MYDEQNFERDIFQLFFEPIQVDKYPRTYIYPDENSLFLFLLHFFPNFPTTLITLQIVLFYQQQKKKRYIILNKINQSTKENKKILQLNYIDQHLSINLDNHKMSSKKSILQQVQQIIKQTGQLDSIIELNLSQLSIKKFTPEIKAAIQKCKNLEILILTQCDLESLDNFPDTDLTAIDLTANSIGDAELAKLAKYQNLGQLILNENNIQKLDAVKPLAKLEHLQEIDLSDNPITKITDYREQIYKAYLLPQLDVLDRFDREGNEQIDDDEEFEDDEDEDSEEFDDDEDEDEEDYDDEEEESDQKPKKKGK